MTGLLDDFLVRATLAAIGAALAAAPLGCFVVWRRMAYFGDATAHAALLGVALALLLSLPLLVGVLGVALAMAVALTLMAARRHTLDTLLGVFAHGGLAFGLVAVSLLPAAQVDLLALLLGDILAVGRSDLAVIWGGAFCVAGLVAARWSALLMATLSPDLARASGIDPQREALILTCALAVVVAVSLKVVGALMVSALLIVPAATVRPFVRDPRAMAAAAVAVGGVGAALGIAASVAFDTPTGPTIVAALTVMFAVSASAAGVSRD